MKKINVAYLARMLNSWHQVKEGYKDFYEEQIEKMLQLLPNGNGIDSGVKLEWERSKGDRIIFTFGYHHLNEGGYYDGWTEHTLIIRPDLEEGYKMSITGRDRNMVKDYLYSLFNNLFYHSVPQK